MNCEDLRQNTAAYVLGALSEAEQIEFERHTAECNVEHDLQSYGDVVSRLSAAAPLIDPPAGLRGRILAAAEADAGVTGNRSSAGAVSVNRSSFATGASGLNRPFSLRRLSTTAYAAAATVLVVIGAAIGWAAATLPADNQPVNLRHFYREEDGDWLRVETELGETGTALSVGNLDPLTDQSRYRFWAIRNETWIAIGEFNTNPEGRWIGEFDFALEPGDTIAITIEPEGGAETPTTDAEIRSRI
ncbi:MAG: anti-sigma factor [Chloroflexi bacterium]|nr:anti-sigma factor [Chloroflexota bacterium]